MIVIVVVVVVASVACVGSSAKPAAMHPPTRLRALYGLEPLRSIDPRATALILVDYQEEFFAGRLPVEGGRAAVARAARLLDWARRHGVLVVHVRNVAARPDSPVFAASSPNVATVPDLLPAAGEMTITKSAAGAFTKTELDSSLRARGISAIVVAGIMTHLAVDSTVRDGALLGYRVVVASDACATRDLPGAEPGDVVDAAIIHRATLAALADRFADVMTTSTIVGLPREERTAR